MSMLTCPGCNSPMDDAPDLAGQMVACPRCGTQFPLPPPIAVAMPATTPPLHSGYVYSPYGVAPVSPVGQAANKLAVSVSRNWIDRERLLTDWPYTIKAAMFAATIGWAAVVVFFTAMVTINNLANIGGDAFNPGIVFLTGVGTILVTAVPYGFVMAILGVTLLVAKKPE